MKQPTDLPSQAPKEALGFSPYQDAQTKQDQPNGKNRIKHGLWMASFGYIVFLLGTRPSLFGLDRSPVVGFVQISVFLVGLAVLAFGSTLTLASLWHEGKPSLAAQIGSRLISTGYVICLFTGLADVFGLGSHPLPNVFFGPLQEQGVALGMITIAVGFLLMIPYKQAKETLKQKENSDTKQSQTGSDQKPAQSECVNFSKLKLFQ